MKKRNFVLRGNKAFTLAEVLITLVIIGVIGALTVPALIQNTRKQEYVSALKKAYSTFSQAAQQIIAKEGSPKCDDGGWGCSSAEISEQFIKHLNILKDCGSGAGCFPQGAYKQIDEIHNTSVWDNRKDMQKFILAGGMQTAVELIDKNCGQGNNNDLCAYIYADLNGVKKPNIMGRDVFVFSLTEKGIRPTGCNNDGILCKPEITEAWGCACKVLSEDAINY